MEIILKLIDVEIQKPELNYGSRSLKKFLFSQENNKYLNLLNKINISFQVGDKIGLLGKNGSGKSTFLKLISGIYPKTSGKIIQNFNTMSSIIDLSVGVNDNLSGYDVLYFKFLLKNMRKSDLDKNLNFIKNFSGLGEDIYKQFRFFSQGMKLRLLVSAEFSNLTDVLLIDEVISTGDKSFSEKSEEFIFIKSNQCKLFMLASHDLNIVRKFCDKGIVFNKGKIEKFDEIENCIEFYNSTI